MINGKIDLVSASLEVAMKYRSLGWPVIPIIPGEKKPPFSWKEYQDRPPTEQEITEWYEQCPEAGVAIVTGKFSGLVVIDIDNPEAKQELEERFGPLPETLFGHTSKGQHYYFRHPGNVHCKTCQSLLGIKGLDIRGDGGYIIAPPTVHPDGTVYTWDGEFDVDRIAELPASLLEEIIKPSKSSLLVSSTWIQGNNTDNDPSSRIVALLAQEWQEGKRNRISLGLSGCLAKALVHKSIARQIITGLAKQAEDDELEDRLKAVATTYQRFANGEELAGLSLLRELALPESKIEELSSLVKTLCTPPGMKAVDEVRALRLASHEKDRKIARIVINSLESSGRFITVPSGDSKESMFFDDRSKKLLLFGDQKASRPISSPELSALLERNFGINRGEALFKRVAYSIISHAHEHGDEANLFKFSYWDGHKLFIDCRDGTYAVIDGKNWPPQRRDNGEDGIFFQGTSSATELAPDFENPLDPFDYLVGDLSFETTELTVIQPESQKLLIWYWFIGLFFPEFIRTKPILALVGDPGSGKTFTLRRILKLLIGPEADVNSHLDEKGFLAMLYHKHIIVLDNLDGSLPKWLIQLLCKTATSVENDQRTYFTNLDLTYFIPRAFLALTSCGIQNPGEAALADRLLILRMKRMQEFTNEGWLLNDLESKRNMLWAGLLRRLHNYIPLIRGSMESRSSSKLRLADFEIFCRRLAEYDGKTQEIERAIKGLSNHQALQTLEGSDLPSLIPHLPKKPMKDGREVDSVSTAELHTLLKKAAEQSGEPYEISNPKALGAHLKRVFLALKDLFGLERKMKRGKCYYYWDFSE